MRPAGQTRAAARQTINNAPTGQVEFSRLCPKDTFRNTRQQDCRGKDRSSAPSSFRQNEILDIVRAEGRVMVDDLAQRFDVTLQTIRRDLTDLADMGHLDRVHGGAVPRTGATNLGYEQRRRMNQAAKTAIARACAAAIPDNCSLIMNLGTTTEAVAQELLAHRNITVVTNNMNVANILVSPGCEIMVAGGALRRTDGGLVGELTTQFFEQFKVDIAVIGASALDQDGTSLIMTWPKSASPRRSSGRRARCFWSATDQNLTGRPLPALHPWPRSTPFSPTSPTDLARRCNDWATRVVVVPTQD